MNSSSTASSKRKNTESKSHKEYVTSVRRNQEQFVKRLVNAQSHFTQVDISERDENRDKLVALKTHAKKFQIQGMKRLR